MGPFINVKKMFQIGASCVVYAEAKLFFKKFTRCCQKSNDTLLRRLKTQELAGNSFFDDVFMVLNVTKTGTIEPYHLSKHFFLIIFIGYWDKKQRMTV